MTSAHGVVAPGGVWSSWEFEPVAAAVAITLLILYRRGRSHTDVRAAAFYVGVGLSLIATMSPLHGLAGTLFAVHMVQHLVLMVVAAPLIAFGRPGAVLAGFPRGVRRRVGRAARNLRSLRDVARNPVVVWCAGTIVLWAWHLPRLYEIAVTNDELHAIEHMSFLGASFLMWRLVPGVGERRLEHAAAIGLVFATALQSAALGAILAFAARPLYSIHVAGATAWGMTPLGDQQLAGAIMWIPPGVIYLATMAVLLHAWFTRMDAVYSPTEGRG